MWVKITIKVEENHHRVGTTNTKASERSPLSYFNADTALKRSPLSFFDADPNLSFSRRHGDRSELLRDETPLHNSRSEVDLFLISTMAMAALQSQLYLFFALLWSSLLITPPVVCGIGVNYGFLGNNLPEPVRTLGVLKQRNIQKIRIFDPNPAVLTALCGTNISVYIGVKNEDLQSLATNESFATTWVQTNILPYAGNINLSGVVAGNEVIPGPLASFVLGAMVALNGALHAANVVVPVSTAVSYGVMGTSYPPSNGSFSTEAVEVMEPLIGFLEQNKYPLLANIYPYFAYISNPVDISADYTFFTSSDAVVIDGELKYFNLFDSMVDALYSAMERIGHGTTGLVVSETGWPSAGDQYASLENAQLYNQNLVKHIESEKGTPKRPGKLETYIFAIYNENMKPEGTEQNFGLYHPDLTEVYHVDFPQSAEGVLNAFTSWR